MILDRLRYERDHCKTAAHHRSLSVLSVGPTNILNLSNDVGRRMNTSFVGSSLRLDLSASIREPMKVRDHSTLGLPKTFVSHFLNSFT